MTGFDLLTSYRPAFPSDGEVDTVRRLAGFVSAVYGGLDLPGYRVGWYQAAAGLPDGLTNGRARPVEVQFRVQLPARKLVETVLHELQHVVDSRDPSLFVGEREQRADQFAAAWHTRACRALGLR